MRQYDRQAEGNSVISISCWRDVRLLKKIIESNYPLSILDLGILFHQNSSEEKLLLCHDIACERHIPSSTNYDLLNRERRHLLCGLDPRRTQLFPHLIQLLHPSLVLALLHPALASHGVRT